MQRLRLKTCQFCSIVVLDSVSETLCIDKSLRTFLKTIWFEKSIILCMKKLEQKSSNLVAFFVANLHVKSMSPGFYYGVRLSRENDIRRPGIPC